MMAVLRTFLMLWLPGLVVLLGGLPAILRTGQVDPVNWVWLAFLLAGGGWFVARRGWTWAVWMSASAAVSVLSLAWMAAERPPSLVACGWFVLVILLATTGGIILVRRWSGLVLLGAAAVGCWFAVKDVTVGPAATRPVLHVITGLPLFWEEAGGGPASRVDAPVITVLRQYFEVRPVDSLLRAGQGQEALLVAQPRAMSSQEMVALDSYVRRGGKVVILADPMLRWPSSLPLGDRRRAPSVSLLHPLFDHWGVRLLPPGGGEPERRHFLSDGRVLTVYEASGFASTGAACRIEEAGLIARCQVGKGKAVLIADADLIDDRLWLADPTKPTRERQWTADTPQYLVEALGGELRSDRRWVRSGYTLVSAVRWSLLIGFFWAALGMAVLCGWRGRQRRTKGSGKSINAI